jgi:hypothetical protein
VIRFYIAAHPVNTTLCDEWTYVPERPVGVPYVEVHDARLRMRSTSTDEAAPEIPPKMDPVYPLSSIKKAFDGVDAHGLADHFGTYSAADAYAVWTGLWAGFLERLNKC